MRNDERRKMNDEKETGSKRTPSSNSQFTNSSINYSSFILHPSSFILSFFPLLLSFFLFVPTLFHPAMYDTLLHTQLADDLNLLTVWLPSDNFGFFRPLVFLPLVLMQQLTGGYSPLLMHIINVMMHVINVALLISLVRRVWRNDWLAAVTGLLFAAFPFAYQALAIYGNNPYLAVTLLILLGLHAIVGQAERHRDGQPRQQWRLLIIFAFGLLTHEMAILLLPLGLFLALIKGKEERGKEKTQSTTAPNRGDRQLIIHQFNNSSINYFFQFLFHHSPFILLAFLYLLIYFFLPRGVGPLLDYGGNAFGPKLLLLLQTLAYPLVPFFDLFLPGQIAIWAAFIVLIVLLFFGYFGLSKGRDRPEQTQQAPADTNPIDPTPTKQSGAATSFSSFIVRHSSFSAFLLHPSSFSSLWFLLFAALVGLTLPTYYIEDGARLLYPMGIGVALLWGAVFSEQLTVNRNAPRERSPWSAARRTLFTAVLLTVVLATLLHSTRFTRRMVGLYDRVATSVWGITDTEAMGEDAAFLFVNFPQWVTWPEEVWPQGNEFAPLLGDHLFMSELMRVNFGIEPEIINLHVPERLANTPYAYGLYGVSAQAELDLTQHQGKKIAVYTQTYTETGPQTAFSGQFRPAEDQSGILATLGELAVVSASACFGDAGIDVEMVLRQADNLGINQTFFVQAFDRSGQLLGQSDGPIAGLPPGRVRIDGDWEIVDRRSIGIIDTVGEPVTVMFGLYDFTNGDRAPALDAAGTRLADDAVRLEEIGRCD